MLFKLPELLFRHMTMMWIIIAVISTAFQITLADFNSCSVVKSEYNKLEFNDRVPDKPFEGKDLKFCRGGNDLPPMTCCTKVMEHKLSVQSRIDFDKDINSELSPFANLLEKKHAKFDELFTNLLNHSRRSFNDVFNRTYGILYEQNAEIFTELFESLEKYYMFGHPDLKMQLDDFFKKLNQKMFTVFNSQYVFDKQYLKCVNRHMEDMKTLGDIPEKLTNNVKRSFVAFRTFVQGLSTAASVVKNVVKINPSLNCLHELMKMTHCSTCAGHQGVRPCLPYCLHVQELCLEHHRPLADVWIRFIDVMEKLGNRLEGPFNVGNEAQPINYKISAAIMNFQESGAEISKKIFQLCGEPRLGRYARSAPGEIEFQSLRFSERGSYMENSETFAGKNGKFSRLVREIKTKLKNSKNFWSELPSGMCRDARHHGAAECWTGTGLGKYNGSNLLYKPFKSIEMDEELFKMKLISNKVNEALNGRDVSWIDEEWLGTKKTKDRNHYQQEDNEEYEGSGMYPVSPRRPQYPPDDEDGYLEGSGEGSGIEPPEIKTPPFKPPHQPRPEFPSSSPKEKPMSLPMAIAVYFVPAIITFFEQIG